MITGFGSLLMLMGGRDVVDLKGYGMAWMVWGVGGRWVGASGWTGRPLRLWDSRVGPRVRFVCVPIRASSVTFPWPLQ